MRSQKSHTPSINNLCFFLLSCNQIVATLHQNILFFIADNRHFPQFKHLAKGTLSCLAASANP